MKISDFLRLVPCLCLALGVITPKIPAYGANEAALAPMIVTANKRENIADDVPASIEILDSELIDDYGIWDTREMTQFVPNLYYKKSASGDAFICRGISTQDPSLYSPMGLYVDDTAYPLSFMQEQFLFDVERVEILRGPQSTLYGKNSSSGVINMVLAKPNNEVKARVDAGVGSYSTFAGGAMVSGPLKRDRLFFKLLASALKSDGYHENILTRDDTAGDDRNLAARGTLRWTPSEKTEVSLTLDAADRKKGITVLRYDTGSFATDPYKIYSNMEDTGEQDSFGQSLKFQYQLAGADFLSITTHRHFNRLHKMDLDRTPVDMGTSNIDIDHDAWAQEFRLTSKGDTGLSWLAGFYAGRETQDHDWVLDHVIPAVANTKFTNVTAEEAAVFGQVTLALTNSLDVTVGLRVDYASAEGEQEHTRITGTEVYKSDMSDIQLLPMAALSYQFAEGIKGYALFSTGFLAGGYDYYTTTSVDNFSYDPEYTRNYEVGLKTAFLNNRIRANLSLFYTTIDDKQVKEEDAIAGFGAWKITNAAQAHTTGFEFEIRALPWAGFELFAGLGYVNAEIDDWKGVSGGVMRDFSGKKLPWAPDFTANAGVGYYHSSGWYGTASLFWAGKQYFDAENNLSDSGYVLVNLKAGYRIGRFDISLYAKNLLDTEYPDKKTYLGTDTLVEDGPPRIIGVNLSWKF